ncbi:hypothetical protein IKG50_00095 [Candidatus Saccharibacteria bacterium]|nr:hypothetical protein [Candidatus Saccharibacteria bacterium]
MNKDVIYIEPEQDITDILANIKASKHKIIALVPPKKAGVLRSAVNFKLIAKTAKQNEKTVVLITTDESLRRLANSVAMPTAKSLQSKPQLPDDEDATEFGDDDTIEEPEEPKPKKVPVAQNVKVTPKKPAEDDVIEGEPEPEEEEKPKTKNEKNLAKMKGAKIPNIKKYRKFIIIGAVALVVIIVFSLWANLIAPYAKISVKVHTTSQNFTEKVSFVDDESKADPKAGIFFIEKKAVTKKAEGDFQATGQVDKGTKATGNVTVTVPKGTHISKEQSSLSIPKGTTFTIGGKEFISTSGSSVPVNSDACDPTRIFEGCVTQKDVSSGNIPVVAKENGDAYNVPAASSGISSSVSVPSDYKVSSTAMAGGTSKMVKVVSKEDVEGASSGLTAASESEARDELTHQFGDDYILLGNMEQSDPKITTSPALNEEVGDNITPKIVKEVTFTQAAVSREQVKTYITEVVTKNLGDDTQEVYDTGVDKAFFESFQNSKEENSAKLKATTKTGPRVTDEMIREKALGKKTGEVQSLLKSIKGVSSVKINTSYFFVTTVPDDTNKVEINIENEE